MPKRFRAPLLCVVALVSLAACGIGRPKRYDISESELTLAWDPPETSEVTVASYRVYYQSRDSTDAWTLLGEVTTTDQPEYTIEYSALTTVVNDYVFAVTSVGVNGVESEYHTSLDDTADPPSGWYVTWTP